MADRAVQLTSAELKMLETLPESEATSSVRAKGLPTRRVEQWKWSDLRAALKADRSPSLDFAATGPANPVACEGAFEIVLRNGTASFDAPPDGIAVSRGLPEPALFAGAEVASLATAAHTLTIDHHGGAPLIIRRLSDGEGWHTDRIRLRVPEGAEAVVIETHESNGAPFANSLMEIDLAPGAVLHRLVLCDASAASVLVHTTLMSVGAGATLRQASLSGGSHFTRHEARLTAAEGADIQLDGLYRLSEDRHNDFTSHVDLTAADAKVRQLYKGIVEDQARGVFQGKFHVTRAAQHTDAQMGHHALLLSDRATVNAKPELEIYADDVECAHGNTVGALDAEALFYLRQRGLNEAAAQSLLIHAFAGEVIDGIENPMLQEAARSVALDLLKEGAA